MYKQKIARKISSTKISSIELKHFKTLQKTFFIKEKNPLKLLDGKRGGWIC